MSESKASKAVDEGAGDIEGDAEFTGLLGELAGDSDAQVRVYRQPGNGKQSQVFLFSCAPDDYDLGELLTKLKEEYGGGDFCIWIKRGNAVVTKRKVSVEAPVSKKDTTSQTPPNQAIETALVSAIQRLGEQQERSMQMMLSAVSALQPKTDMVSMQGQMLDNMIRMREALQPVQQPMLPPAPARDILSDIEQLLKVKAMLGSDSPPSGENPGVLLEMVKSVLPTLGALAAQYAQRVQAEPAPRVQPPKQADVQPIIAKPEGAKMNLTMMTALNVLLKGAKRNDPVERYVGMILTYAPEGMVLDLLDMPEPMDALTEIRPEVEEYRDWFEQLIDELRERIQPEDDVEDEDVEGDASTTQGKRPAGVEFVGAAAGEATSDSAGRGGKKDV